MSSCCDTNQEEKQSSCCDDKQESATTQSESKTPTGFIEKIFWKIGKADAAKNGNKQKKGGCC